MRSLLLGILIFLTPVFVNAQTAYKLTAIAEGSKVIATLEHQLLLTKSVIFLISDNKIEKPPTISPIPQIWIGETTLSPSGKTTWSVSQNILGGKTYYLRVFDPKDKKFLTDNVSIQTQKGQIYFGEPVFEKKSEGYYFINGKIDIQKHKESDIVPYTTINIGAGFHNKETGELVQNLNPIKPNEKGEYSFEIITTTLNPNSWYELKMSFDSPSAEHTEKSYTVNTKEGIIPETGKAADDFFDKNSYRLLAPIPGMSALLDPALCQLEKQTNPGQICDVNTFLNFMLNLLIGLAAVVLVVRIIITGYGYMITDVPFVKAKMKGGFRDALLGLIVALASYTILNTINPKLVENEVVIGGVEFEVEDDDNEIITEDRFIANNTTRVSRNCKGKIVDVRTGNGSFIDVCDEISKKIELMFSDAKKAGIILSGGGYRTYQEQVVLYNKNCGGGKSKCNPPTARPGTSMHETGKAFDLKCDGSLITFSTPYKGRSVASTKKCFDWLNQNAYKYGLKNLKKENWHWSVNGK